MLLFLRTWCCQSTEKSELEDDRLALKNERLIEYIFIELPRENSQRKDGPVTEGPTVLKHKKLYYLIYSVHEFRNADHAVCFATNTSPLASRKKSTDSPFIFREIFVILGAGYDDVLSDKEALCTMVFSPF